MSLPTLETPTYKVKLYSIDTPVKYRPYTVKEEKVILMAIEDSDTDQDLFDVVLNLCQTCIFDDIDLRKIPVFDLEKLVIAIRSKSVGEEIETGIKCVKCEHLTDYKANIEDIKTLNDDFETKMMLSDSCGITLKFPALHNMKKKVNTPEEELNDLYRSCIDTVFDSENVYPFDQESEAEQVKFIDSLTTEMVAKINEKFLSKVPKNYIDIKFQCPNCGHQIEKRIDDLISFFI
tara:strand:- start:191 stop:892 length:702 start_codon:yes stop_codon:yes gene_type:complete